jgi:hypothetical protein
MIWGTSITEADIKDGDYALLRRTEGAESGEIMLVRHDNSSTLKRIKVMKGAGGRRKPTPVGRTVAATRSGLKGKATKYRASLWWLLSGNRENGRKRGKNATRTRKTYK